MADMDDRKMEAERGGKENIFCGYQTAAALL